MTRRKHGSNGDVGRPTPEEVAAWRERIAGAREYVPGDAAEGRDAGGGDTVVDVPAAAINGAHKEESRKVARPATRRPRLPAAWVPFPAWALPCGVREYAIATSEAVGCDLAYPALFCLTAAAAAVGNSRTIRLKRDWEEPSIIWSVVVGDSGTLKSPAYLKALRHVFRAQRSLLEAHRAEAAEHEEEVEAHKSARRRASAGGPRASPPPQRPVCRRLVCSDVTIEKVAAILDENPRGILVARDELAGWFGSFTRYKDKGSDLPNWLECYRGGPVTVDRKGGDRPTLLIPHANVSVTGGIQPGVLARALTAEHLDAGLGARLLMAQPPRVPKRWTEKEIDLEVEQNYEAVLDRLYALELELRPGGELLPHALRLSPQAKATWVAFYNEWADEQAAADGPIAAALSKLEGYAARLALAHHVVSCAASASDDRREIGQQSLEAGVALARWFAGEARRIYGLLSEADEDRDLRRLLDYVGARGGSITVRQLQRANNYKYPTAEAAQAALDELASAGLACWGPMQECPRGGNPARSLSLLPTPDTCDT